MTEQLILHIPHSSTNIPIRDGYVVDDEILQNEILKLTDWYTDDLFFSEDEITIKAGFSRIFCDSERFSDDSQEVMAQFGMGVLYEKSDDGAVIRDVPTDLREEILKNYYWRHHNALSNAVNDQLNTFNKALIIDCHSYPNVPLKRDLDQRGKRPDFNIGTDSYHTPLDLIEFSKEFFSSKGYSLGIDWPYSGSIVPLEHYQTNRNVQTIMLEVNRALYLKGLTNKKSEKYNETKQVVGEFIEAIKKYL